MSQDFVSLMYHNVIRDDADGGCADVEGLGPSITSYFVGERDFARQLDAIMEIADVPTFGEMQRFYLETDATCTASDRPLVQLTFDDGWRGTLEVAGPLLADRGLQALVFVTTGLIGAPHFLTRAALADLPAVNLHVGSHTVSHRFLNELPDDEVRQEMLQSRQTLEDIVGYSVEAVSIPNGAADERVVRIAEECGYRFVFLSDVHVNNRRRGPLEIGRVAIRATTALADIKRYSRADLRREILRSSVLQIPKRVLGPERYRRLRNSLLRQSVSDSEMSDLFQEQILQTPAAIGPLPVDGPSSPECGLTTGTMP